MRSPAPPRPPVGSGRGQSQRQQEECGQRGTGLEGPHVRKRAEESGRLVEDPDAVPEGAQPKRWPPGPERGYAVGRSPHRAPALVCVPGVGWSCTGTRPPECRSLSAAGRGAGTGGGAWGHPVVPQDEGVSQRAGPSEVRAACPDGHQSRTQGVSGLPTQRLPWTRTLSSLSGRHPWEDPERYPPRRPGGSPWALSPATPTPQASASVTDSPSWLGSVEPAVPRSGRKKAAPRCGLDERRSPRLGRKGAGCAHLPSPSLLAQEPWPLRHASRPCPSSGGQTCPPGRSTAFSSAWGRRGRRRSRAGHRGHTPSFPGHPAWSGWFQCFPK